MTITRDRTAPTPSGLESLRARAAAGPSASSLLGMAFQTVEDGFVEMVLPADERHGNPFGMLHGGIIATLLDSALGCAVHSTLPAGVEYTTIDLNVKFIRGLRAGESALVADGRVVHGGRRTATATGEVRDEEGRLVAHGSCTCLILGDRG